MRPAVGILAICVVSGGPLAQMAGAQAQEPAVARRAPQADNRPAAQAGRVRGRAVPAAAPRGGGSGSLLRAAVAAQADPGRAKLADVSFYAVPEPEPRTLKKHDLITIIIREESTHTSKGSNESSKESDLEAAIEEWAQFRPGNMELEGGAIGGAAPSLKIGGKREFKGKGKVDRSDKFIARIQGEIVDVKPNGTLVLQARSRIKTDDEEQMFILSGTCRVEDVTADNSVLSTQMFDKNLVKSTKGDVRNASRRGWIPKLLDALNPF